MGKIAILMVGVVLAASAQCMAACGVLPCNDSAARQTAPVEDCHHEHSPAPPSDHDHSSTCGHQLLISEAGPQAASMHIDLGMMALLAVNLSEPLPETPVLVGTESDRSPPPSPASASRTILRV
ncbi:MAG: hypothetical protein ABI604_09500 [Nitrospirota bacterium]